jgi:hypothetical protein
MRRGLGWAGPVLVCRDGLEIVPGLGWNRAGIGWGLGQERAGAGLGVWRAVVGPVEEGTDAAAFVGAGAGVEGGGVEVDGGGCGGGPDTASASDGAEAGGGARGAAVAV